MDWDESLFRAVNGLAGSVAFLDGLMVRLGSPGQLTFPILLAFAYWVWYNRRQALIGGPSLALLIIVADFLGAKLKAIVARPRPCQALQQVNELVGCGGTFSFPSNHALNTATAAAFFHVLYPKTARFGWPLVALIGISRVYIGGHYVTDVIGGWILGGLIGAGAATALLRWPYFHGPSEPEDEAEPEKQS